MKLSIKFEQHEIDAVKTIVAERQNREFVKYRLKRNVEGSVAEIDDEKLWMAHMMCLLGTQQRSGPNSAVNVFLSQSPFPLSLNTCLLHDASETLRDITYKLLTDAKGIRRTEKISKAVSGNLAMLKQGEWDNLRKWRDTLLGQRKAVPVFAHRKAEEEAAHYMDHFTEFGPKQSRNFWQSLGLTRYVFVLDSRVIRWLRQHLTFQSGLLTANGLADEKYYHFVSDILLELCTQAEILPCMFDAAVFDSFDEGTEWGNVIW